MALRLLTLLATLLLAGPAFAQDVLPGRLPSEDGPRRLNGPRIGVTYLSPGVVDRINDALTEPGEDDVIDVPLTTQFGWQFEFQTFQSESGVLTGVAELVPLIGGLERGRLFPTVTFLAGVRTRSGFEVGVGPNISLTGASGVNQFDDDDSSIAAGLALAVGQGVGVDGVTIPINAAAVLSESGVRLSVLVGLTTSRGRY
ncbi:MAG: hypothetical protein AAGI52_16775 [Bacteroidota bacterium]